MSSVEIPDLTPAEKLVREFEGCALRAYKDIGGTWTIGWGAIGPDVVEGLVWTQEQADARLASDLAATAALVRDQVKVPLSQTQFCALVSFTFNEGAGHLEASTLLAKLNAGDLAGASDEFPRWDKCRGVAVPGLLRRRMAERELFLAPVA